MKKIILVILILILCFGCTESIGNAIKETPTKTIQKKTIQPSCVPTTEVCDGKDNDCDKEIDEGVCDYGQLKPTNFFSKTILSDSEINEKLNITSFGENLSIEEVKERIKKEGALWKVGETSLSRLSTKEKENLLGLKVTEKDLEMLKNAKATHSADKGFDSLPDSFDWRNYHGNNYITDIRNQGDCGSCWAFAAVAVLEGHANAYYNNPDLNLDLSEQDLVSCFHGNGCSGAYANQINDLFSNYYQNTGVATETCFPYTATDNDCANKCSNWQGDAWKTLGYQAVPLTIEDIKQALIDYGPVEVGMEIYEDFYYYYESGIYSHSLGGLLGHHAVTIVGFGITDGIDYWIVKNSWGEDWGENGYFRIKAGDSGIDSWFAFAVTEPNPPNPMNKNCVDNDLDGYCFWGLGEKPTTGCPTCDSTTFDCDDSNPSVFEGCGMTTEHLGSLSVNSIPSMAKVFVKELQGDGWIYRGNTPIIFNLNQGEREIKITKEDYENNIQIIQIVEDETSFIEEELLLAPKLIYPKENSIFRLGSTMEIKGTVPNHYSNYKVEYEEQSNPGLWNLIFEGFGGIIEGTIADFNTAGIEEGLINIKLTTIKPDATFKEVVVKNISLDSKIKEGWPFYFLDYNEKGVVTINPAIEDITSDGKKEIILKGSHQVFVLNRDGELLNEGWPQKIGCYSFGTGPRPSPTIGDIDGDGEKEILITSGSWWGVTDDEGLSCEYCAYAWDLNGNSVDGWPIKCSDYPDDEMAWLAEGEFVLSDLDEDKALEAIVNYEGQYKVYYPATLVFKGNGTKFGNWPFTYEPFDDFEPILVYGTPAVGDVDCDGEKEIVVFVEGDNSIGITGFVYILSPDATVKNKFWIGSYTSTINKDIVLADLDDDCDLEIILEKSSFMMHVFNHDGSDFTGNWPYVFDGYFSNKLSVGKINENDFGIAFSEFPSGEFWDNASLVILDDSGNVIWKSFTKGVISAQPSFFDIDGDLFTELFGVSMQGYLYGYNSEGNVLGGFPKKMATPSYSGVALADLENRGGTDLVTSDYENLYVWEVSDSQSYGSEWSQFQHDATHSGLYTKPPICGDIDGSSGIPDISDLIYLLNWMFFNGPEPISFWAANVDGKDGVDIQDLVYLVQYMFNDGDTLNCAPITTKLTDDPTKGMTYEEFKQNYLDPNGIKIEQNAK